MGLKRRTRRTFQWLLKDRERFELWAGLSFFTLSLALFLSGWTVLRGSPGEWVAVPAGALAVLGLLGLSGKLPLSSLLLNRGLVAYEPKRGGQVAVLYGSILFGLGVFGLSSLAYYWLSPFGSYGLAALLSTALLLGGLYVVGTTPVLDVPTNEDFQAHRLVAEEPDVAWYEIEDEELAPAPLLDEFIHPEVTRYDVPLVKADAAAKRPGLLSTTDILAYATIDSDWMEGPDCYTCIEVEEPLPEQCLERGDVVGINHAPIEARWLVGRLIASYSEGSMLLGILQHEGPRWMIRRPGADIHQDIQPVEIIGAVEWSVKANSKAIRPAGDVGGTVDQSAGNSGAEAAKAHFAGHSFSAPGKDTGEASVEEHE